MNQESRIMNENAKIQNSRQAGFSLVEGILAAALFGIIITALVGLFIYGQESTRIGGTRIVATFLAEEGMEAVRNIRDDAYANIDDECGTGCGLGVSGNTYAFSGSSDTVGIYTRTITIENETSPTRRKVISKVTWNISDSRQGEVELENHFTNWR